MPDYLDVHLTIRKRRTPGGPFPMAARREDQQAVRGELVLEPPEPGSEDLPPTFPIGLLSSLSVGPVGELISKGIEDADSDSSYWQGARILLEVKAEELYSLPWELIAKHWPLPTTSRGPLVVRYSSRPALISLIPFSLPIDVFYADLRVNAPEAGLPLEFATVFQYFAVTAATKIRAGAISAMMRSGNFDIVHFSGMGTWDEHRQGRMHLALGDDSLGPSELKSLLAKSGARLAILETQDPDPRPFLDLAQRLLAKGGPPVVVVAPRAEVGPARGALEQLYLAIVHDTPLDYWLSQEAASGRAYSVLARGEGGDQVLRLSGLASRLRAETEAYLENAREAQRYLSLADELSTGEKISPGLAMSAALDDTISNLEQAQQVSLSYEHETGGLVPLTEISGTLAQAEGAISQASAYSWRVVNTWFQSGSEVMKANEWLPPGTEYEFRLQIGAQSAKSNVLGPRPIPEAELEKFYSDEGLDLRVILFSQDFEIDQADRILRLPKPPMESEALVFRVQTPTRSGQARLRACVYFRHNLIQSLNVSAMIGPRPSSASGQGNFAEVEFALTDTLEDVEHLSDRTVNVLVNQSPDSSHQFEIVGSDVLADFSLTEGEMRSVIDDARDKLQAICSTFDRQGKPARYRFEPDNHGNEKDFVGDIQELATFGYELYTGLVTHQDWDFQEKLRAALGPQATIQISSTKSANYVFPWALVYDHPLVISDDNSVCPDFLSDLAKGGDPGFLEGQVCLRQGCAHLADTSVVCPSGFWGFKHKIEQPLSRHEQVAAQDGAAFKPVIEFSTQLELVCGISETLKQAGKHTQDLGSLPMLKVDVQQGKLAIGQSLKRTDIHIVYFYCHGGRSGRRPWLGVGRRDRLYPTDLNAWDVRWPTLHPLVFINGCETVGLTPDDLLSFNKVLAYCRAAGVIGTEIVVPESLAVHFAEGLFDQLLAGASIGDIFLRQRLLLLERYNPLGLVYTPYCYSDLHAATRVD